MDNATLVLVVGGGVYIVLPVIAIWLPRRFGLVRFAAAVCMCIGGAMMLGSLAYSAGRVASAVFAGSLAAIWLAKTLFPDRAVKLRGKLPRPVF